ncbi:MAG: hypothetical protein AABY55_06640 [Candidatus Omnitrophota bacterium]
MFKDKITRKEFLKMAGFGALAIWILPGIKKLKLFKKTQYKEAKYYKTLAG